MKAGGGDDKKAIDFSKFDPGIYYFTIIQNEKKQKVKIEVGSALTELDDGPEDYEIRGRDLMTGIPKVIKISSLIAASKAKLISATNASSLLIK